MLLIPSRHVPFSNLVFCNKGDGVFWKKRIELIKDVISLVELSLVIKKYRKAATVTVSKNNLEKEIGKIKESGLIFTPIKWVKKPQNHHHHYFQKIDSGEPDSLCYGVITRSTQDADTFKKASEGKCQHDTIGELLGFPKCCRQFFAMARFSGLIDPTWQQALNSGGKIKKEFVDSKLVGYSTTVRSYPECVSIYRSWGIHYSYHIPCCFTCKSTLDLNKTWIHELNRVNKKIAADLHTIFSKPVTWCALKGVAIVYSPFFKGITDSVPCQYLHTVYLSPAIEKDHANASLL